MFHLMPDPEFCFLRPMWGSEMKQSTKKERSKGGIIMASGRLNVVKDLKQTNQIVSFGGSRHIRSL
jgi:predicted fused transcriptional regulator/phosphomethylpyrimidine kinase